MRTHDGHVVRDQRRRLLIALACAVAAMALCTHNWAGAGRTAADDSRTAAEYARRPEALGLYSPKYSVVEAFIEATWGKKGPIDEQKVFAGGKARVDTRLGSWTFAGDQPLPGLGEGVIVRSLAGEDRLYRDRRGVRLIVRARIWVDTLILSAQCTHEAQLIRRDLRALRTESGIGLGDAEASVLKRLGSPCRRDRFQEYTLLWYRQKPKRVAEGNYDQGHAAVYALKDGRVVEIWLHEWDNERRG